MKNAVLLWKSWDFIKASVTFKPSSPETAKQTITFTPPCLTFARQFFCFDVPLPGSSSSGSVNDFTVRWILKLVLVSGVFLTLMESKFLTVESWNTIREEAWKQVSFWMTLALNYKLKLKAAGSTVLSTSVLKDDWEFQNCLTIRTKSH